VDYGEEHVGYVLTSKNTKLKVIYRKLPYLENNKLMLSCMVHGVPNYEKYAEKALKKTVKSVGGAKFDGQLLLDLGVEVGKGLEAFLPDQRAQARLDPGK